MTDENHEYADTNECPLCGRCVYGEYGSHEKWCKGAYDVAPKDEFADRVVDNRNWKRAVEGVNRSPATYQDNLKAVRAACIAANPELLSKRCEDCFPSKTARYSVGCMCRREGGKLLREITLPYVLLALGKLGYIEYEGGGRSDPRNISVTTEGLLINENGMVLATIDLRTGLSGWSKEAVAALANLLKKDA